MGRARSALGGSGACLAAWFAACLAAGCSGDDDRDPIVPPADDDDDDDDTTEPVDTAPEGAFVDASGFFVVARFAFDPALGVHVGYAEPGEGLSPVSLGVVLFDSAVLSEGAVLDDTTSCEVTLELAGNVPIAPWGAESAWTGFDVPADTPVRDGCRFYDLPGNFTDDAGAHVAKWSWGAGVGPIHPKVVKELRQQLPASEWAALEPLVVGGFMRSDLPSFGGATPGGLFDQGIALGYAVDGNFEIVAGGTGRYEPIPAEDVETPDEDGVARGFYEVTLGPFGPGEALTQTPGAY